MLAMYGIWSADANSLDFDAEKVVTRRELARALAKLHRSTALAKPWIPLKEAPRYGDVPAGDSDRPLIESLIAWGDFAAQQPTFHPDQPVDWGTLNRWALALDFQPSPVLSQRKSEPLNRAECVRFLWQMLRDAEAAKPLLQLFLKAGSDVDGDARPDLEDALPWDRDNDNLPDHLDPN